MPEKLPPIPEGALARFHRAAEASEEQRKAILAAKEFRAGNQWPTQVRQQREGAPSIQGVAAQPARPCLTVDRISQPVRQVSNSVRQSNFEIKTLPVGDGADVETAKIYNGWMRRVQNDARDEAPVEWAADQAAEGGIGWFRLTTFECNTDLDTLDASLFDQDLRMDRIVNNLSVYPDPAASKPTRSDMRYLFQTESVPRDEFKRLYPKASITSLDEFRATGDEDNWVDTDTDSVRVAEYWHLEYDDVRVVLLNDGRVFKGDQIPDGAKRGDKPEDIKRDRTVMQPTVHWDKITCTETLSHTTWLGSRIPYIPILGEELNVDGKTIVRGVIQPAMDAQRMVNYTYSAAVEAVALAPKAPFIYAEGQIEQYKTIWQTANTTNYFGLPYTPVSLLGQPVPPPQRSAVEAPIQAMVELMLRSEEGVKATTGIFDPSLGNVNTKERSGAAIDALKAASQFGQSNYQDNVTRALIYAGELMVELGPKILDRPGRVLQILELDGKSQQIMLGQPFTHGEGGIPQAVPGPDGQPVMDPKVAMAMAGMAKFYDLSKGKYGGVVVAIGRDHTTRRQESNDTIGSLIPHLPPNMAAAMTPAFIETLDIADAQKIADIARRALPPELQDKPELANLPPAVKSMLGQMQQGIAARDQALGQAKQIIDTEQIKNSAMLERVKLEGTKDLLLANVNNAAKILVAHIQASKDPADPGEEAALEEKATSIQLAHEAYQAERDRAHEFTMKQVDHAHALDLASHEAALAPEPAPAGAGA